jgi:hypothetical protein
VCIVCGQPRRDCECDLDERDDEMAEGIAQAWCNVGGSDGEEEDP